MADDSSPRPPRQRAARYAVSHLNGAATVWLGGDHRHRRVVQPGRPSRGRARRRLRHRRHRDPLCSTIARTGDGVLGSDPTRSTCASTGSCSGEVGTAATFIAGQQGDLTVDGALFPYRCGRGETAGALLAAAGDQEQRIRIDDGGSEGGVVHGRGGVRQPRIENNTVVTASADGVAGHRRRSPRQPARAGARIGNSSPAAPPWSLRQAWRDAAGAARWLHAGDVRAVARPRGCLAARCRFGAAERLLEQAGWGRHGLELQRSALRNAQRRWHYYLLRGCRRRRSRSMLSAVCQCSP